jgi:hypothetical protein
MTSTLKILFKNDLEKQARAFPPVFLAESTQVEHLTGVSLVR